MSRDHTQEALDEYYTTGIDPTGGDIGPDFNPETGEYLDDLDEQEQAFYAEEAGLDDLSADSTEPFMAGIERLERIVDRRIAEVEAQQQRQSAADSRPRPTPRPQQTNELSVFWSIVVIAFFIVMLIMIIKYL